MSWYLFWKLLHLLGAFGFVAAHGATAAVSLKLRREREPDRVRALLDLSKSTRSFMYVSLVLLLTAGIANGFVLHAWSQGWIWTALALLLFLLVAGSRSRCRTTWRSAERFPRNPWTRSA